MLAQHDGSRWYALFPVKPSGGVEAAAHARSSLRSPQAEVSIASFRNGQMFEFSTPESLLEIDFAKPVYVLADRIVIHPDLHQRIVDTVEICYREAGEVFFETAGVAESAALALSARSLPAKLAA